MGFRDVELGGLLATKPRAVASELKRKFSKFPKVSDTAYALGVDAATVYRWLAELKKQGIPDPRDGQRAPKGPPRNFNFDPDARHAQLNALFSKGMTQGQVAYKLGVDRVTVIRWVKRLIADGYDDPRIPSKK